MWSCNKCDMNLDPAFNGSYANSKQRENFRASLDQSVSQSTSQSLNHSIHENGWKGTPEVIYAQTEFLLGIESYVRFTLMSVETGTC